jgi:glycopeptide antibiotics resistance protein
MQSAQSSLWRSERVACLVAVVGVIGLGLIWRSPGFGLPPSVKKYGGDALWAVLVYLLIRFFWPRWTVWKSAWTAFAVSVAVEVSQLYHAGWIDAIRVTRLGALSIGSVFNAPDIAAYAAGIVIVALIHLAFRRKSKVVTP